MPTIELTDAELVALYDTADHGLCALDDTLNNAMEQQFYSEEGWQEMKDKRPRWAAVVQRLSDLLYGDSNAKD